MLTQIFNLICTCPIGAAIGNVTVAGCPENFGQVNKIVFQRMTKTIATVTTPNEMTLAAAALAATWAGLIAAGDDTKAQGSPILANPSPEVGTSKLYGGGNATPGGREINLGRNPSKFVAEILRSPQSTIKELKLLECETLGVFFINDSGIIMGDEVVIGSIRPFEIYTLSIGDKEFGGFDNPDKNAISFSLPANWSDDAALVEPEVIFNPLTDI